MEAGHFPLLSESRVPVMADPNHSHQTHYP